jgi:hypothetical protein
LVKKIDAATAKNNGCSMGSFVVFCNDDEKLEEKLKELAKKEKIKKTVLTIGNPAGPNGYNISKNADVTVLLYVNKTVKANFAFKKGKLGDKDITKIIGDLKKILPKEEK